MLRAAISSSQGKIRSSTILRKLSTHSRKNKLYWAFCELGRVVRTVFLLNYGCCWRIVNLVRELPNTLIGNRIGGQLLDVGTRVGANFEEAYAAISHADFTHKIGIAKKEAFETNYWLRLIRDNQLLPKKPMSSLINESEEINGNL